MNFENSKINFRCRYFKGFLYLMLEGIISSVQTNLKSFTCLNLKVYSEEIVYESCVNQHRFPLYLAEILLARIRILNLKLYFKKSIVFLCHKWSLELHIIVFPIGGLHVKSISRLNLAHMLKPVLFEQIWANVKSQRVIYWNCIEIWAPIFTYFDKVCILDKVYYNWTIHEA